MMVSFQVIMGPILVICKFDESCYYSDMFKHLRDVNESYWQHLWASLRYSWLFAKCMMACLVHAIIPDLFQTYSSTKAKAMVEDVQNRIKR